MKFISDSISRKVAYLVGLGMAVLLFAEFVGILIFLNVYGGTLGAEIFTWEHRGFALIVFLMCLVVLFSTVTLNVFIIQRSLARPLDSLTSLMEAVERGNFLVRAQSTTGRDELSRLAKTFNQMLMKITDLTADQFEQERELIKAQEENKYRENIAEKARQIMESNMLLEIRVKELSLLHKIGHTINSSLEIVQILRGITSMLGKEMGYRQFVILLMDEAGEKLTARSDYGFSKDDEGLDRIVFNKGEGVSWLAAESGEYLIIPDTRKDPRYMFYKGRQQNHGTVLFIPMMHQGRCVGMLTFIRPVGSEFPASEIEFLSSVANQLAIAIINASLHQKTVELTITDALTGVFNRRYFDRKLSNEMEIARRYNSTFGLFLIDIDHFKKWNDIFGHSSGDNALKHLADTLVKATRRLDTVARYGGEEFCILLPKIDSHKAAEVAEKLRKSVAGMWVESGLTNPSMELTVSIGVAVFPDDGDTERAVVDAADMALYHAKNSGRNRVEVFQQGMCMPAAGATCEDDQIMKR